MLTTLNILAILLGMTIVGLFGYFVIKTIINRSGNPPSPPNPSPPNPPPPNPPPSPTCSSTNCDECTNKDECKEHSGCEFDELNNICIKRTTPPSPPCSSTNCDECTTKEECSSQTNCIYKNGKCQIKPPTPPPSKLGCNINQIDRVNVPGCSNQGKYNCTDENTCLSFPGNPCFEKIEYDPNSLPWCYIRNGKECHPPPTLVTTAKLWKGTGTCLSAQAGGFGKCSDLVPQSLPQNITLSPSNVTNGKTPFQEQWANEYVQKWTIIDGGTKNMPTPAKGVPNNNKRAIAVTIPRTQPPSAGYPYVLCWQFMDSNGMALGWYQSSIGGIAETDLNGNPIKDDASNGQLAYNLMLKYIVASGYVLVNISELVFDTEFMMDCGKTPNKSLDQMCWNDGNNVDADALRVLFDKIDNGQLIQGLNLDYNNMAALGYSVGSHMVSRMINDFPFMTTSSGLKFPTIRLGIMIGGGSYWCYNYDGKGNQTDDIPKNYEPCADPVKGCCPNDRTEDNYDPGGQLSNNPHPPVLLLQGEHDMFASWEASSFYFNILSSRGDPVYRVMGPRLDYLNFKDGWGTYGRHGVYGCQIPAIVALLEKYVKPR